MPKLLVYSVNQAKKQEPVQVLHVLLVIQDGIEIVYEKIGLFETNVCFVWNTSGRRRPTLLSTAAACCWKRTASTTATHATNGLGCHSLDAKCKLPLIHRTIVVKTTCQRQ